MASCHAGFVMYFLPIATRELRQAARRRRIFATRLLVGLLGSVLTLLLMLPMFSGLRPATNTGRSLFLWLAGMSLLYALLAGVFLTADSLSEEKRSGTIGLLFLTSLRGYDIVLGKLLATSLNAFYGMLAIFPVMGLNVLIGGVTGGEFFRVVLVLMNTLFLSLSAGMLASALTRDGRLAFLGALLVIAGLSVAPALSGTINSSLSLFSPPAGFFLALDAQFHSGAQDLFWNGLVLLHVGAWAFLVLASAAIHFTWREGIAPASSVHKDWRRESVRPRRSHLNPVVQLLARSPLEPLHLGAVVLLAILLWLAGDLVAPGTLAGPERVHLTMFVLHAIIKIWIAWEVTRWLANLRGNGELEILLVCPLSVREIAQGQMAALRRRFLLPVVLIVAVDLFFLDSSALASSRWVGNTVLLLGYLVGIGLFLADSYTIAWVGMWQGATAKNSTQAFMRTLMWVLFLPSLPFLVVVPLVGLMTGGAAPIGMLGVGLWFACGYFADLTLCGLAINRFFDRFRLAAAQGILRRN